VPFIAVAELSHGLPWDAGIADRRLSQVCTFSGFAVGNAADFDPSPGCGPPSAEPRRSRRQAGGRKARSLRYRLSTLVLRRDFLSLDQRHNIGHRGRRLQARRSRSAPKTMRQRRRPLQATWGEGKPGRTARNGGSLKSGHNVLFGSPPQVPQFGENDPSTEFPRKRRSEFRSSGAALDVGLALPAAHCHLLTAAASQAGRSIGQSHNRSWSK
jgi:hypothetical protein